MDDQHPFSRLTPDFIMDAVESVGYHTDARIFGLNSYVNRGYQIGLIDSSAISVKFYRPERWNNEQILEEHVMKLTVIE